MSDSRHIQRTPSGLILAQAVQVITTLEAGQRRLGSGYQISKTLVLTAGHVVVRAQELRLRFLAKDGRSRLVTGEPWWSASSADIALVRVTADSIDAAELPDVVQPALFGHISQLVEVETLGFPRFKLRAGTGGGGVANEMYQFRDSHHARGFAAPWSNLREGTLEITVGSPERDEEPERSPWEGISGAAVFARGHIIGVVVGHHRSDGLGTLTASRVERWYTLLTSEQLETLIDSAGLPTALSRLPDVSLQGARESIEAHSAHSAWDSATLARQVLTAPVDSRGHSFLSGPESSNLQLPAPTTVHNTLPRDTSAFTGRTAEMERIIAQVADAAEKGGVVSIHAIHGMPGVGKTTLAVHVGHLLSDRFPDQQLFVDLHAHSIGHQPSEPAAVLASLLIADGVDAPTLPPDIDSLSALWRRRQAGKRTLLILDNAASSRQVIPLLPGSQSCLTLITSRRYLGDLPSQVFALALDPLPASDAEQMFIRLAPRAAENLERVGQLVALSGYLPLAIALLASVFNRHRAWNIDNLISETKARLLTVSSEDRSVEAAFDLSFQNLTVDQRRFFRLLGLHPGRDFDIYAAAALGGISPNLALDTLDTLHRDQLIVELGYHRFQMHDLIRAYARKLAVAGNSIEDNQEALNRLLEYYRLAALAADSWVARQRRPTALMAGATAVQLPPITDQEAAWSWLRAERANLLACMNHTLDTAQSKFTIDFVSGLTSIMDSEGQWAQAADLHGKAVQCAREIGDAVAEADALYRLGQMYRLGGEFTRAGEALEQAVSVFMSIDNKQGAANCLNELGIIQRMTGDYSGALNTIERTRQVYRKLGDRLGEATALNQLGATQRLVGNYASAIQAQKQALTVHRDLENRLGVAQTFSFMGVSYLEIGEYIEAERIQHSALEEYRAIGNANGEAQCLRQIGMIRCALGDYEAGNALAEQCLELYTRIGNRLGRAHALALMAIVKSGCGEFQAARTAAEQAEEIYRTVGDRFGQAGALCELAKALIGCGAMEDAREEADRALNIFQEIGNLAGQARSLNILAILAREAENMLEARKFNERAVSLAEQVGTLPDQVEGIEGLADTAYREGRIEASIALYRRSLEIHRGLAAPGETGVIARLRHMGYGGS